MALAFDLFLHGGLLAGFYAQESPFLLAPEAAFRRIPIGYLGFLGVTIALAWLVRRVDARGWGAGFKLGAASGAVVWGSLVLGLYSIATASVGLLAGWWAGQTIELGLSGAVLGAAAAGVPTRRIWVVAIGALIVCLVLTIAMQSVSLAPQAGLQN